MEKKDIKTTENIENEEIIEETKGNSIDDIKISRSFPG